MNRLDGQIDIGNLHNCIEDVVRALQYPGEGTDEEDRDRLIAGLNVAKAHFPLVYQKYAIEPLIHFVTTEPDFCAPTESLRCQLTKNYAAAILQRAEGDITTRAFQEIVDDLFVSFLDAEQVVAHEKGMKIKVPELGIIPPLVRWFRDNKNGPLTYPNKIDSALKNVVYPWSAIPLVCLPPGFARGGLVAWTTLAHETVGHDILMADIGLLDELKAAVMMMVAAEGASPLLTLYWGLTISEVAADIMGVLHLGPAAAIGLVTFFRGFCKAYGKGTELLNFGSMFDPHPPGVLREVIVAETVRLLKFSQAELWANFIEEEALKDLSKIGIRIQKDPPIDVSLAPNELMIKTAKCVARTIVTHKLFTLENHALRDIQCWSDEDEARKEEYIRLFQGAAPKNLTEGCFAPYVLAAATEIALRTSTGDKIDEVFERMISLLSMMHKTNPNWTTEILHSDELNVTVRPSPFLPDPTSSQQLTKPQIVGTSLQGDSFRWAYGGAYYIREHRTCGDGACAIHALLGEQATAFDSEIEYAFRSDKESSVDETQRAAKQVYLDALAPLLRGGNPLLKVLLDRCVEERLVETREFNSSIQPIDKRLNGINGMILEFLSAGSQFYAQNATQLDAIFVRGSPNEYRAFQDDRANQRDFSQSLLNCLDANWSEIEGLNFDHPIWSDFLLYRTRRGVIRREREAAVQLFVQNNFDLYQQTTLSSDIYLSVDEVSLAAQLIVPEMKVFVFYDQYQPPHIFNVDARGGEIAIEHSIAYHQYGNHYSRLEVSRVNADGAR